MQRKPRQPKQPTKAEILAHAENLRGELGRRHLLDFIKYTFPAYCAEWFHIEVCEKLEQFFEKVERRERPRLIIEAPPQHGKSEIIARRFPAWIFGKRPDWQIIGSSYGSDRAELNSRDVQNIIESERYQAIFPHVKLDQHRSDIWNLTGHQGVYRAAGVGGGIAGWGAHVFIIDDPVRSRADANSPTIQGAIWRWFIGDVQDRLAVTNGGIVIMMTPWSEGDPGGRIRDAMLKGGDKYEILSYPAIAEEDERHRKRGEALAPGRTPIDKLIEIRDSYYKLGGGEEWLSKFQCRRQPTSGRCFFVVEGDEPNDKVLRRFEAQVITPKRGDLYVVERDKQWEFREEAGLDALRVWEQPLKGYSYVGGVDIAGGRDIGDTGDTDCSIISMWRRGIEDCICRELGYRPKVTIGTADKPAKVMMWRGRIDLPLLAWKIVEIGQWCNLAQFLIERNAIGEGVLDFLKQIYLIERLLRDTTLGDIRERTSSKLGLFTDSNKPALISDLKQGLREDRFDCWDAEALFEYRHFVSRDGKLGAEHRYHDDIVIADALACRAHLKAPWLRPGNLRRVEQPRIEVRPISKLTGY